MIELSEEEETQFLNSIVDWKKNTDKSSKLKETKIKEKEIYFIIL